MSLRGKMIVDLLIIFGSEEGLWGMVLAVGGKRMGEVCEL